MNSLTFTKTEINELLVDTLDVGKRVITTHKLIDSLKDINLQQNYQQELQEMIASYYAMCDVLKHQLEVYLKYERDNNIPVTLIYEKLLRRM